MRAIGLATAALASRIAIGPPLGTYDLAVSIAAMGGRPLAALCTVAAVGAHIAANLSIVTISGTTRLLSSAGPAASSGAMPGTTVTNRPAQNAAAIIAEVFPFMFRSCRLNVLFTVDRMRLNGDGKSLGSRRDGAGSEYVLE